MKIIKLAMLTDYIGTCCVCGQAIKNYQRTGYIEYYQVGGDKVAHIKCIGNNNGSQHPEEDSE